MNTARPVPSTPPTALVSGSRRTARNAAISTEIATATIAAVSRSLSALTVTKTTGPSPASTSARGSRRMSIGLGGRSGGRSGRSAVIAPACGPRASGCRRGAGAAAARAGGGLRPGARGSRDTRTGSSPTGCRRGPRWAGEGAPRGGRQPQRGALGHGGDAIAVARGLPGEEQRPARRQHALELRERAIEVGQVVQHGVAEHEVEAPVVERQLGC